MIIDSTILDRIWRNWIDSMADTPSVRAIRYSDTGSRFSTLNRKFEDFLFSNGAIVIQEEGKRYLKFFDAKNITLFLLKYG